MNFLKINQHLFLLIAVMLSFIACDKNTQEGDRPFHPKATEELPLPQEKFEEVAVQYKDALDFGLRGPLVTLTERNSFKIIRNTINLEHMIYFAAVNGIGTNKLIVMIRSENPKTVFADHEIAWINERWKLESDALLDENWKKPVFPEIVELKEIKTTTKKEDEYEYYVHFSSVKIPVGKYSFSKGYYPFYWEVDKEKKHVVIPEVRINLIQTAGLSKVDLTKTDIKRNGKWENILNHPLFLWRGEIPKWAEETMKHEKYFFQNNRGQ